MNLQEKKMCYNRNYQCSLPIVNHPLSLDCWVKIKQIWCMLTRSTTVYICSFLGCQCCSLAFKALCLPLIYHILFLAFFFWCALKLIRCLTKTVRICLWKDNTQLLLPPTVRSLHPHLPDWVWLNFKRRFD